MKKVFLLCALACAGQMYGMEQPGYGQYMKPLLSGKGLPTEIQAIIISYLNQDLSLDETVDFISNASRVNKELNKMINLGDLKGFTKIVHMLADKFNKSPYEVAKKFKTRTAKKYLELSSDLRMANFQNDIVKAKKYIAQGADVLMDRGILITTVSNLNSYNEKEKRKSVAIIKLLLENGANPYDQFRNETALQKLNNLYEDDQDDPIYIQAKTLLEEAMKNYKQHPPSH